MLYTLTSQMLILALIISGVPLLLSSVSGLIVSILQAATSIQDQSISYLVKLGTLVMTIYICGNWFLTEILELIRESLIALAFVGR